MSTRRGFLLSTLTAAALPAAVGAGTFDASAPVRLITEVDCYDTRDFARQCALNPQVPGTDPAQFLFDLERELAGGTVGSLYGLTKASNAFLIEQTAAAYGYRRIYHGQHRYGERGLRHSLEGAPSAVDELVSRFGRAPTRWVGVLAHALDVLSDPATSFERRDVTVAATRPADSAGHLVSWLLRRV